MSSEWKFSKMEEEVFKEVVWETSPEFYQHYIESKCGPNPKDMTADLVVRILNPETTRTSAISLIKSYAPDPFAQYQGWPVMAFICRCKSAAILGEIYAPPRDLALMPHLRDAFQYYLKKLADAKLREFLK